MHDLDFTHPWMAAAVLLLPLLVLWYRGSLDGLTKKRRTAALCARLTLCLLLALALMDVRYFKTSERRAFIGLIDVSRSLETEAIARANEFATAHALAETYDHVQWIAFAGKSRPLESLEDASGIVPATLDDDRTDIAGALRFAMAHFPAGHTREIGLFSDGRARAEWPAVDAMIAESRIRLNTVMVSPPVRPETLVRSLDAPMVTRSGEPFTLRAEIVANQPGPATVKVYRQGILAGSHQVELDAGPNRYEFVQETGADKLTEFSLTVETPTDTLLENNRQAVLVRSSGEAQILLLTDNTESSRYLALALRQEDINLEIRPTRGVPVHAADLRNYDLLIIDNIPATDMSLRQQDMIADYVRNYGGGLIMLGGDNAFGLGGYYRTPIEEILPVKCDFEKEEETPSLGLALVIDKSGSMKGAKMEMAKAAARAAIALLDRKDYAGVAVFDGAAFWAADMQPVFDKFGLLEMISTIQASGGTSIAPALDLAFTQLASTPAKIKHIILLTDGHSQPGPFYEIVSRMSLNNVTVSTVAVGGGADQALLEQIARWGNGRYYYTDQANRIPQIFAKETMTASKSAIRELPFQPRAVRPADFLAGIDIENAPFLYGYVMTEAKPTSEVWLRTEKGEPLLATWRIGFGQTAAFTSDTRNRWAVEWLRWPGYPRFWAQTIRRLMRTESLRPFPATIISEGQRQRLVIDAVDADGNLAPGVQASATISGPDGSRHIAVLNESLPGKLEAVWDTGQSGQYHVDISLRDANGNPIDHRSIASHIGFSEEFMLKPPDTAQLKSLADNSGGAYHPEIPESLAPDDRISMREHALWPVFMLLALGVFMLDVALRRWPD